MVIHRFGSQGPPLLDLPSPTAAVATEILYTARAGNPHDRGRLIFETGLKLCLVIHRRLGPRGLPLFGLLPLRAGDAYGCSKAPQDNPRNANTYSGDKPDQ